MAQAQVSRQPEIQFSSAMAYPPTVELFHQGHAARTVYVLQDGFAKLTTRGPLGRSILSGIRGAGDILGLWEGLLSANYSATATILQPSIIQTMSIREVSARSIADSAFARWLNRSIAREAQLNAKRVASFGGSGEERLLSFITELLSMGTVRLADSSVRPLVALTREEIGQAIGLGREQVTRLLMDLERRGAMRRQRGWITIPPQSPIASM